MMRKTLLFSFLPALAALPLLAADTQGISHQQAEAILDELKAIHELLLKGAQLAPAQPAAPSQEPVVKASLKIAGAEILGSQNAPVTMVEFSDYQCPFCRQFHMTTFDQIRKKYVETGKIRFVTIDFPLPIHPNAEKAGEAAHCAADQRQFWPMRDTLSVNADKLSEAELPGYAQSLYMDVAAFKSCLSSGKYKQLVSDNQKKGEAVGVNGTPTFLIGKSTPDGVDGIVFVGAQPIEAFESKFALFGVQ